MPALPHNASRPRYGSAQMPALRPRSAYLTLWYGVLLLLATAGAQLASAEVPVDNRETFVLSGTVVNSVTGEPISRALVRASGQVSRTAFTDTEGHFQLEGMPAGQIMLTAQKPGYSSEQDANGYSFRPIPVGPNTGAMTIKLQPLSAIAGRVTDATGQPIEHITVRLTCRSLRDGRKVWEPRGMMETDEDGRFRFSNLMPATYFLSVGPAQSEGQILPAGEKPTTGFPLLYFPNVPDLASAAPIQLGAGQQFQADFSLNPVPVYHVAGNITGQLPEHGVGLSTLTSSGDSVMLPVKLNSELGTFSLEVVPAGSYILTAVSDAEGHPMRAEQKITVAANLENVHLTLSPSVGIPVIVHMQSHASSDAGVPAGGGRSGGRYNPDHPPINVSLLPTQPNATEAYSSFQQKSPGNVAMVLQNVEPGTYSVNLLPHRPWYVQSASYGQTNALYDDITVSPGQSYPLEISLRDDSASLTVTVRSPDNASQRTANVILVPQPASRLAPHVLRGVASGYTEMGLAPGDYLVFAFDQIDGLEYTNPDALSTYASSAAHVTLSANQPSQVSVDLIQVGKGE